MNQLNTIKLLLLLNTYVVYMYQEELQSRNFYESISKLCHKTINNKSDFCYLTTHICVLEFNGNRL